MPEGHVGSNPRQDPFDPFRDLAWRQTVDELKAEDVLKIVRNFNAVDQAVDRGRQLREAA